MLQAITTTFVSNNRIEATCEGKSLVLPYERKWSAEKNHQRAAMVLLKEAGWSGKLHGIVLTSGEQVWAVIPDWMAHFGRWCDSKAIFVAEALHIMEPIRRQFSA